MHIADCAQHLVLLLVQHFRCLYYGSGSLILVEWLRGRSAKDLLAEVFLFVVGILNLRLELPQLTLVVFLDRILLRLGDHFRSLFNLAKKDKVLDLSLPCLVIGEVSI